MEGRWKRGGCSGLQWTTGTKAGINAAGGPGQPFSTPKDWQSPAIDKLEAVNQVREWLEDGVVPRLESSQAFSQVRSNECIF